jgi:DNA polymerase/3'-5' exonuclease PolX
MTNAELARALARIGAMLEIDGANSFRVRAYEEGAGWSRITASRLPRS